MKRTGLHKTVTTVALAVVLAITFSPLILMVWFAQ
jgi:hypothetical protein